MTFSVKNSAFSMVNISKHCLCWKLLSSSKEDAFNVGHKKCCDEIVLVFAWEEDHCQDDCFSFWLCWLLLGRIQVKYWVLVLYTLTFIHFKKKFSSSFSKVHISTLFWKNQSKYLPKYIFCNIYFYLNHTILSYFSWYASSASNHQI